MGDRDTPKASSPAVAKRMRVTRQENTNIEVAIRKQLFRAGLRYRLHPIIDGTRTRPDIAFIREKVAVFVDSCFWHWCPHHGTLPKVNAGWWGAKLQQNVERDRRHSRELRRKGWQVMRVWEHEDVSKAVRRISGVVLRRR